MSTEKTLLENESQPSSLGAVSGSISEIAMNWWYNMSDYKTDGLIMKHKMRKPIREEKIIEVYKAEVGVA